VTVALGLVIRLSAGELPAAVRENIASRATATASSVARGQVPENAIDGQVGGYPDAPGQEWSSSLEREGAWLQLDWPEPVEMNQVWIYDRVYPKDRIESARLLFDDGRTVETGMETDDEGGATKVGFEAVRTKSLRIEVTKAKKDTRNAGLAEVVVLNAPFDFSATEISGAPGASQPIGRELNPAIQPVSPKLNGLEIPSHVIDVAPVFSWGLPDGVKQHAWRIRLGTEPGVLKEGAVFFDSGWVESDATAWEYWPPDDARRLTRVYAPYYWSVQVKDAKGRASAWTPEQHFELGVGLPPKWIFGIGWSRYNYENSDQVREVAKITRKLGIPGDWIHPDLAWGGHMDTMKWSEGYADAPKLIEEIRKQGFHFCVIDHHGISASADPERAAYLDKMGWLDKTQTGPLDHVALNLRLAAAREYYQENFLKPLYEDGVSSFKLDGTCGWGSLWRNRDYRLWDLYHKMFFDAQQKYTMDGNGRGVITARTMSKPYPGIWTDDIPGTWDLFASQIQVLGSLAREDVAYVMADAGGFNSRMTPEGFARWSQQALLSPLVWTHDGNEPWRFYGQDAMEIFRDFAKLRYRLIPYLYTLAAGNYADGSRIALPMDLAFPDAKIPEEMKQEIATLGLGFFHNYASDQVKGDFKVRLINTQYMLGKDLLVVPVIHSSNWSNPDFENRTVGVDQYLATYVEPETKPFDEALQTCQVGGELVYRVRPLAINDPKISIGFCAMPRWERDSGIPWTDVTVEGEKMASIDPKADPGMGKPLVVTFPAKDKDGDGWVEIRIKATPRTDEQKKDKDEYWEQKVAGKERLNRVFANVIWEYDGSKVAEADLLSGSAEVPFRMNLGVFNQKIHGLSAERTFWVPPGNWTDWFTSKHYTGPAVVTEQVPVEHLLLLVREGAILPLQPQMDYMDQKPLDPLTLIISPSTRQEVFELYEDDDLTRDHQRGIFAKTRIEAGPGPKGVTRIHVDKPEGPYADKLPPKRRFHLEVLGAKPASVEARDAAWTGNTMRKPSALLLKPARNPRASKSISPTKQVALAEDGWRLSVFRCAVLVLGGTVFHVLMRTASLIPVNLGWGPSLLDP